MKRGGNSETILLKSVVKATREWGLIENGDRILVAVSGGKDSTSLAYALSAARREIGKDYSVEAIHISTDFCSCCKKSALAARLTEWGIPFNDLFVPVIGRLKPGKKMNCYWCSTQRRTELLRYACDNGFNKIALGHHMDDIVETLFMNMLKKGTLTAMPVRLEYAKYPVTLIRPLALLEERQIIEFATQAGIMKAACTCPYGRNSERKATRSRVALLTDGSGEAKRRILASINAPGLDLLVESRSAGQRGGKP